MPAPTPGTPAPFIATMKTVYHVGNGPTQMYPTDANSAVARFPQEWSHDPWPPEQTRSYNEDQQKAAVATAKAAGMPPPPPPEPVELYEEEQQVLADYEARVKEARDIIAKDDAYRKQVEDWERTVADARAFLLQPAPQASDLVAERESRLQNVRVDPNFQLPDNWKDRPRAARLGFARRLGAGKHVTSEMADQFLAEHETKQKAAPAEAEKQAAEAAKQAAREAKQQAQPQKKSGDT